MKGLQEPPKSEKPSRLAGRLVMLVVFALGAGIVIYTAVSNQNADLTEDIRPVNLQLEDKTVIDGFTTNVREDAGGPAPVVILHDADMTGGLILDDLSMGLPEGYHGVRIDLPGFGYSTRMPNEGPQHTVAGMAKRLAPVLEERFDGPVPIVGVGLGGEVAAELAYSYPQLVDSVVMVDVDFWSTPPFPTSLESLPWVGKAATFTWETGGRFALDSWSPYCNDGGWCPTPEDASIRSVIVEVENTTDSMYAFRRTRPAALAPANLDQITVPITYVWSSDGSVSESTVARLQDEMGDLTVTESDSYQAYLEDPTTVAAALESVARQ